MIRKIWEFGKRLFDAEDGKSVTRRALTFVVLPVWLIVHVAWAIAGVLHGLNDGGWDETAAIIGEAASELNSVAWIMFLFYFGTELGVKGIDALASRRKAK